MSDDVFFDNVKQQAIKLREFDARLPIFYRKMSMMVGVFSADLDRIRALLPDRNYRPLALSRKRGLISISCFEYVDTDIGPYNEVALCVLLRRPGGVLPSCLQIPGNILSQVFHAYVIQLPVTTSIALFGGVDLYQFPKYMAGISFFDTDDGKRKVCQLRDVETDELICSFTGRKVTVGKPNKFQKSVATLLTYPQKDQKPITARFLLKKNLYGTAFHHESATVTLGLHSKTKNLESLNIGRCLYYVYSPECLGILFGPTSL